MASQIASLEDDRRQYQEQLDIVAAQIRDDSDNAELKGLHDELRDMISLIDESIAELKPAQPPAPKPTAQQPSPPPPPPRAHETRPGASATPAVVPPLAEAPLDEEPPVPYQVNDEVLAKWMSGDKKFWPARITSITGSSAAPIYLVKFKSYKGTETLRSKDIRPVSNKRKADSQPDTTPVAASASAASDNNNSGTNSPAPRSAGTGGGGDGTVLSAAASRYPAPPREEDQQAKPPRPKKIKATRELEAGKNKWQEFSAKSKGSKGSKGVSKAFKKESMFRTPEGVHGRVGFTGSGQAMRKDPTRSRHVYQANDDLD
ncbi:uncharacterized protein DNG_00945 [Cephalotrichum gorgonifer]|uniref:Tudor domain-containing protein n=1 Tax=Cephalotrichum gorgonifer TaxID=2041049 RepID=A0AAE8MQT3_9PEZI|nr:uncharacterized protein DNG_00945 [Cephalotrichum gorgonifer]